MRVSVVIKTRDEAERLRLVLASLAGQTPPAGGAEIIVVDDGSSDATPAVIAEAAATDSAASSSRSPLPLRWIRHAVARGRSAAANAGGFAARGELLLFLDGDSLAGPNLIALHAAAHAHIPAPTRAHGRGPVMARGETYHLRCTRLLQDPGTGTPRPGQEAAVRRLGPDLPRHLVTRRQVTEAFGEIERRAQPGLYPGAGPRRLFDLEMDAITNHPDLSVLWMAVSAQNFSVPCRAFQAAGGFDEQLTLNEHRELALRLSDQGLRVVPVPGARTYHLTHRVGWRDPLADAEWMDVFCRKHPRTAVQLMCEFWRGLSDEARAGGGAVEIRSLVDVESRVLAGAPVSASESFDDKIRE